MKYYVVIVLLMLSSCLSFREKIAGKKIERKMNKIERILQKYPNLKDSLTTTVIDTVTVKGDSGFIEIVKIDTVVDIDSILVKSTCDQKTKEIIKRIYLKEKGSYVFEDKNLRGLFTVKDGRIGFNYKIKDHKIVTKTKVKKIVVNPKKDKGSYWWWLVFIFPLLLILTLFLIKFTRS